MESDRIRKALFPSPHYSSAESAVVHHTCHALIDRKLAASLPVIYDATNLIEHFREKAYRVAQERRAELVVVRTVAPERVVRERLQNRHPEGSDRRRKDQSDADWDVYQILLDSEEPIAVPHIVVHTATDAESGVARVLQALE